MDVKHTDDGTKGIFFIEIEGKKMAEITYLHQSPHAICIEHTQVDDALKGQGVGYKLIEASVAYVRSNNLKVIPICSYAQAVFKKRQKEFADILTQ